MTITIRFPVRIPAAGKAGTDDAMINTSRMPRIVRADQNLGPIAALTEYSSPRLTGDENAGSS
jgi:hypothetical protein